MHESTLDPSCAARRSLPLSSGFVLSVALAATPVAASGPSGVGGLTLSGSTSSYYAGGELDDLAETLATFLYILLDDEDDWDGCDDDWLATEDVDLGIHIPQAQYGVGVGLGLTSTLTLGARFVLRQDLRANDISLLWGGGPELVYTWRDGGIVRPYLGAGFYLTRGITRQRADEVAQGTTLQVRAGVSVRTGDVGYFVQTSFQRDRLLSRPRHPVDGKAFGMGMGLTFYIE